MHGQIETRDVRLFQNVGGYRDVLRNPQLHLNSSQEWLERVGRFVPGYAWQTLLAS
ncbi:MAG: hypothetical protein ACUVQZ_08480 [Candidatus Caldatribacteriaceae bacterium]